MRPSLGSLPLELSKGDEREHMQLVAAAAAEVVEGMASAEGGEDLDGSALSNAISKSGRTYGHSPSTAEIFHKLM